MEKLFDFKLQPISNLDLYKFLSFYLITLTGFLLRNANLGRFDFKEIMFFASFTPVFVLHTTQIGFGLKNLTKNLLWIGNIGLNKILYGDYLHLWILILLSFIYFHILRLIFTLISRQVPIPLFVSPGIHFGYNKSAGRKENYIDLIFTLISFFGAMFGFVLLS